jgi:hypothetical protein
MSTTMQVTSQVPESQAHSSPAHGANDNRFKDLLSQVRADARNKASADRSKAVLFGRVIKGAVEGYIDSTKDKHGKGIDDAKMIYDVFIKGYSDKDPNSHSPKGVAVHTSKLRGGVRWGEMSTLDALAELSRCVEKYKALRGVNEGKDVKPEFEALYSCSVKYLAPEQNGNPLSDEQIADCCRKPEKSDKDLVEVWAEIAKKVTSLVTGENNSKLKDQSEEAIAIQHAVHEYATKLLLMAEEQAAVAKLAEIALLRGDQS